MTASTPRSVQRSLWRGRSWQHWMLRVLLVLSVLGILVFVALNSWADRKLASVIAAIEAQGISMRQPLMTDVPNAGVSNASHALAAACHLTATALPDPKLKHWLELPLDEAVQDAAIVAQARTWLERPIYRLALETLDLHAITHSASPANRSVEELALAADRYTNERAIPALNLRSLLRARALVRMADGQADMAYADAAAMLRIASWLPMELPSILSWIVGNAVATSGLVTLEELLQVAPPSAEAREHLRVELLALEKRSPSLGLEAEMVMSHRQIARGTVWSQGVRAPSLQRSVAGLFRSWIETAYHAYWLEAYGNLIQRSRIPAFERPPLESLQQVDSPFMIPVKFLIPNLRDSIDKTDAVRMRYRLALLALAWQEYREARGAYPQGPADLVPGFLDVLPTDEMSGGKLTWRREPSGGLIYSVGVNQKDDHGVDRGSPQSGDEDDIRWRLP